MEQQKVTVEEKKEEKREQERLERPKKQEGEAGVEGGEKEMTEDNETGISLQRQTYLVLGSMILLGLLLGLTFSYWWFLLPTLLAIGMLTAGIFGVCTMTRVLSILPWNEPSSGDIS